MLVAPALLVIMVGLSLTRRAVRGTFEQEPLSDILYCTLEDPLFIEYGRR